MPSSRHIQLTDREDRKLREIEQGAHFRPKVRLRAQVLRLSNRRMNLRAIASHTGRSRYSISRDLDRFEKRGFEGLVDGKAPGNPARISGEVREYMEGRLQEHRTWNATQMAQAIEEEFGLVVTPEAVRQHLLSMGYCWKRTRYVPSKDPDPEKEREAKKELKELKKEPLRERLS